MRNCIAKLTAVCLVALVGIALAVPATAYAASPKIISTTKAEDTAYNRCVKAAKAYKKKPQTITVSIKDLKLTKKQVVDVETRLHSNGELWWINTFGLGLSTSKITMPCKYSDAKIDKMRAKFEKAVAKALKRIGPGMSSNLKVHMLHDYLVKCVKYEDHCKNAYEALVNKKADCFGYTLATDVLLRRAGFSTDVAFNNNPDVDHSWNLVKLGKNWYHVDTTWDRYFTWEFYGGKRVYHKWLLQSDKLMNSDEHKGWEAHHRCQSDAFEEAALTYGAFGKHCNDYKNIVRRFTRGGIRYEVTGVKKVRAAYVHSAFLTNKAFTIPQTVSCNKVKYTVVGIAPKAFAKSKAKTLTIQTTALTKAQVKNSFLSSKVKKVFVPKAKYSAYKKYFKKGNSGKSVTVKKATTANSKSVSTASTKLQAASV